MDPLVWIVIGILVIIVDLHTINFIKPIGLGIISVGGLLYAGMAIDAAAAGGVVVTLITYYPFIWYMKKDTREKQATPEDEYVGKTGKVIEVIDEDEVRVEVGGEIFYAITEEPLKVDDKVEVVKVEGVKLYVRKKE
jgi:membrane protein implicated in regulation of membrane protease activity